MDKVKIYLKHREGAQDLPMPSYMTPGSAGMDLCADVEGEVELFPGEIKTIGTGLSMALPIGFEGQLRPRSGLAAKHGVTVLNSPGTIDSDYRGEIKVILINLGKEPFKVRRGDRIAQLVIAPVMQADLVITSELEETLRGDGGFGHTGT
jgi:dUTP pyrophosphatase